MQWACAVPHSHALGHGQALDLVPACSLSAMTAVTGVAAAGRRGQGFTEQGHVLPLAAVLLLRSAYYAHCAAGRLRLSWVCSPAKATIAQAGRQQRWPLLAACSPCCSTRCEGSDCLAISMLPLEVLSYVIADQDWVVYRGRFVTGAAVAPSSRPVCMQQWLPHALL